MLLYMLDRRAMKRKYEQIAYQKNHIPSYKVIHFKWIFNFVDMTFSNEQMLMMCRNNSKST